MTTAFSPVTDKETGEKANPFGLCWEGDPLTLPVMTKDGFRLYCVTHQRIHTRKTTCPDCGEKETP
jgi:hypothetical protein